MKWLFCIIISLSSTLSWALQDAENEYNEYIITKQNELNESFLNPETSPLLPIDFKNFNGLDFYPINPKFSVISQLIKTPDELPFLMPTTTDRTPLYIKFGELHFKIDNQNFKLDVYQNMEPKPGYENYLFLPFTDLTSGDGSYGGGRYIDLLIPETDTVLLDFNLAYNPYCVYNSNYSCPIPPEQNDLKIRIEAGVKDFNKT